MTFKSLLIICVALVGAQAATHAAAEPEAPFKLDPTSLGRLDAFLTVCAKADEKNRATYERYRSESIVFGEGTDKEMRVEGSDSPEYKKAYAAVTEAAGKASREELTEQCSRTFAVEAEKRN